MVARLDAVNTHLPYSPEDLPADDTGGSATMLELIRQFSGQVRIPVRIVGAISLEMVDVYEPLPSGFSDSDAEAMYSSARTEIAGGADLISLVDTDLAMQASAVVKANDVRIITSSWRFPDRLPIYRYGSAPVKSFSFTFTPKTFTGSLEFHVPDVSPTVRRPA